MQTKSKNKNKNWMRLPVLSLVLSSLIFVIPGCGGGSPESASSLSPSQDTTLDPSKDSTMNPGKDPNAPAIPM